MVSSANLATIEPWMFSTTLAESWISEASARDNDTLTKALQKSLSSDNYSQNYETSNFSSSAASAAAASPFFNMYNITNPDSVGSGSGSDPEISGARTLPPGPTRKISKRKSRASKRATTTFITADPANFRQMVQQVTGVRLPYGHAPATTPVLIKPEPQRQAFVNRVQQGCLPTLDTSAFLLDRYKASQPVPVPSSVPVSQPVSVACSQPTPGECFDDAALGFDFDSFQNYPTLESWK